MTYSTTALFSRLLLGTPLSPAELDLLITTAPSRYKEHTIKKRNGRGLRLIAQPTAELKFVQRLLVSTEFKDLKTSNSVTAYCPGRSILDHAKPHASSRYLLKLDFENFFPSLKATTLAHCIEKLNRYSKAEIGILVRLLCRWNKREQCLELSIGAPSSPFISNWILSEFDKKLGGYCDERKIKYTRYADDLALSSSEPRILDDARNYVLQLLGELRYLGLRLNDEKTVNVSKKFQRQLVGLILANDGSVSIGRDRKRILRATVHAMIQGLLEQKQKDKLKGQLAFCIGIDPDFVRSIFLRYKVDDINSLFSISGPELPTHDSSPAKSNFEHD